MRLVAVSIVKNEADIIEAFVRHTFAWVDHHLIFDHDSTDGTREILGALQREGLPVTLYTDDALGNLQQARSNHLTRLAADCFGADWVLPLDADEILTGSDRAALEVRLAGVGPAAPASLPLVNYYPVESDNEAEINPVLRLRHCQPAPATTKKIIVPGALARDPQVVAGKGSHQLACGDRVLPDHPLPPEFYLAHLALRSPQHQVLRVVLAEIQKNSRGQAHAGLDVHYRLGFQLLAENPEMFFSTINQPAGRLKLHPLVYRGSPLRYSSSASGWSRVARALLPYLDKLATSHGALLDGKRPPVAAAPVIRELPAVEIPPPAGATGQNFSGFAALDGLGPPEGPVPEAFLPVFHWGYAPSTRLTVGSATGGNARLTAEVLTYSDDQAIDVEVNGVSLARHAFTRVNQRDRVELTLPLRAGDNELVLRYRQGLVSPHDQRRLAVIFLALRVTLA